MTTKATGKRPIPTQLAQLRASHKALARKESKQRGQIAMLRKAFTRALYWVDSDINSVIRGETDFRSSDSAEFRRDVETIRSALKTLAKTKE